jgi:hypothetical protein
MASETAYRAGPRIPLQLQRHVTMWMETRWTHTVRTVSIGIWEGTAGVPSACVSLVRIHRHLTDPSSTHADAAAAAGPLVPPPPAQLPFAAAVCASNQNMRARELAGASRQSTYDEIAPPAGASRRPAAADATARHARVRSLAVAATAGLVPCAAARALSGHRTRVLGGLLLGEGTHRC